MKTKVFKLFGKKIWETVLYGEGEAPVKKVRKPQGEVLEYTPEQAKKDKDKATLSKMEDGDS